MELKTFEEIYQLREKYIDISRCETEQNLRRLTNINDIDKKLKDIKPNYEWYQVGHYANGLHAVLYTASSEEYLTYLICDNNNNPIGTIAFQIDNNVKYPAINEIILIGFKRNNITLVKDVISLINELKQKYYIHWTVQNKNPIKRAYDKYIGKLGGNMSEHTCYTKYSIKWD